MASTAPPNQQSLANESESPLPYYVRGQVVEGFGRGSKELGIPTANFPENVVERLPSGIETGIYFGWACVDKGDVYKMVMSIGWNPFYHNVKKSMETHILHKYQDNFYGSTLSIVILGYIRPEKNFDSYESLIDAIHNDISQTEEELEKEPYRNYRNDPFFTTNHL